MNTLGVDFGAKKIGLALFQDDTFFPLPIIRWDVFPVLREAFKAIVQDYDVGKVVVGVPSYGATVKGSKMFIKWVKSLGLQVYEQNEDYSTIQARADLDALGVPVSEWESYEDSFAAVVILSDFLRRDIHHYET